MKKTPAAEAGEPTTSTRATTSASSSSSRQKRSAEQSVEDLATAQPMRDQEVGDSDFQTIGRDDDMDTQVLEMLHTISDEIDQFGAEEAEDERVILTDGTWCGGEIAFVGDLKEMQGLADRKVFKVAKAKPPGARFISSRMVRRWKMEAIKSRFVLRDIARSKATGGELFAATPSLMALRLTTAVASLRRDRARQSNAEEHVARMGDFTQAFVNAEIDEEIVTNVPTELVGMELVIEGVKTTLAKDDYLIILKALYGYRRSPQLWQKYLTEMVEETGVEPCRSEPTVFFRRNGTLLMLAHVDDLLAFRRKARWMRCGSTSATESSSRRPRPSSRRAMRASTWAGC